MDRVKADRFAAAMTDLRRHLNTRIPGSRLLRDNGAAAWITGLPYPAFNSVWLERPDAAPATVAALLDEAAAAGVPYTLELRPGSYAGLADIAMARGLRTGGELPLMILDATADGGERRPVQELRIRQIGPDEAPVHAQVAAAGFGGPKEMFLLSPDLMRLDGLRCYLGQVDGHPVATAIGITVGEFTAIANVATDPAFRRRGFGAAVTARAVADGVRAGAAWCWLQSTNDGYPVYRNLGFETIETWPHWVAE